MSTVSVGSSASSQRREFDLLGCYPEVEAGPAASAELAALISLARLEVPGIRVSDAAVARVHHRNPESVVAFRRNGSVIGGVGFLFLNEAGLDDLLLDEIDFSDPAPAQLTHAGEEPAAIYIWALAARGRAFAGLANTSIRMRAFPYGRADYYAQPSSNDGVRFLQQFGFEQTPSYQRDLWTYRRLCLRAAGLNAAGPDMASPDTVPGLPPVENRSLQDAA